MDQPTQLDEIDSAIVRHLRRNGRRPYKEIADELGVSEGTIRNRVSRMTKQQVMRIVAVTDPFKLGYRLDAIIGVEVDLPHLEAAAAQLSEYDELRYVGISSGIYDLIIAGTFASEEHILQFLTRKVAALKGVRRTQTFHILRVQKRSYDWTPVRPVPSSP